MSSDSTAPKLLIKTASSSDSTEIEDTAATTTIIDQYQKLKERCDSVISKIKTRKNPPPKQG